MKTIEPIYYPDSRGVSEKGLGSRVLPAVGAILAFLPSVTCPACWPVYASVLSTMGVGFLLDNAYLTPLLLVFLPLALLPIALKARARGKFGPLILAGAGVATILLDHLVWNTFTWQIIGAVCFMSGSIWNAWFLRTKRKGTTKSCCSTMSKSPHPYDLRTSNTNSIGSGPSSIVKRPT